jgi:transposase
MKKVIYVGLDVHQRSITIAELHDSREEPLVREIQNASGTIRKLFSKLRSQGELRCCYEAGPCGFELYRLLSDMGVQCEVIAPALIPRRAGDRVKTDRRDAVKLARLYRAGELTSIRVPDQEQEGVRDLVRARDDARKDLVAAKHRLAKFLLRRGRIFSEGKKNWTQKHWKWIRAQQFEGAAELTTFQHYVVQVEHLEERRAALEKEIHAFAQTDPYRASVGRLSALRGISTLGAMVLIGELLDLKRFESPRQLMAFVGITPSEYSSGEQRRLGGITKTGNSHVRRILIEASWSYRHRPALGLKARRLLADQPPDVVAIAKKAQQRLHSRYTRLVSRGKKSQVAVTAVARELCGFVWAMENRRAA